MRQATVGQYETLRLSIGVDTLEKIALALETPISYFLSDLESEKRFTAENITQHPEPNLFAKEQFALYKAYVEAGFTDEQAFTLINK